MTTTNRLETEGNSPFYPDRPVPVELFRGRKQQIDHILQRGVGQVARGKAMTLFVEGEYGIGKSSIAALTQRVAERDYGLHGIYVSLAGATDLNGVAEKILTATAQSGAFIERRGEKIRNWMAKYVRQQSLFGLTLNLDALKEDAPQLTSVDNLLGFLAETVKHLKDTGTKGVFLIFDEINGITSNKQFAHFLKGLVDLNAIRKEPVPLLLLLCGVEERRRELIQSHEPVGRIFEVVAIERMSDDEMREFYTDAFSSVGMRVRENAMQLITRYAAGFPKIMHIIGNAAYWKDDDGTIDFDDAIGAVLDAAKEVGTRYVTQQVYAALRSPDYRSILSKIATLEPNQMSFTKAEVEASLTESEKGKLNNFLQKMKRLNVIRSGDIRGEYIFNKRLVRLFIWLQSVQKTKT